MKRNVWVAGVALLALSACDFVSPAKTDSAPKPQAATRVEPPAPLPETGDATTTAAATEKGGFIYDYPSTLAESSIELGAYLVAQKDKAKAEFDKSVADFRAVPSTAVSTDDLTSQTRWKVESETPQLTVLTSEHYTYGGGAHGMNWTEALLWDKEKKAPVPFIDLFSDKAKAKELLTPVFCTMLDAERTGRRGAVKPAKTSDDMGFWDCPSPFDGEGNAAVWLTERSRDGVYQRIGWSVPPYTAGPYAEGQYNFTTAIPAQLADLAKPDYKALFLPLN